MIVVNTESGTGREIRARNVIRRRSLRAEVKEEEKL